MAGNTSAANLKRLRLRLETVRVVDLPVSIQSAYDHAWALLLAEDVPGAAASGEDSEADKEGRR